MRGAAAVAFDRRVDVAVFEPDAPVAHFAARLRARSNARVSELGLPAADPAAAERAVLLMILCTLFLYVLYRESGPVYEP